MPQSRKYDSNAHRQRAYRERLEQAAAAEPVLRGSRPLPAIRGRCRWRAAMRQAQHLLNTVAREMGDYFEERSEQWKEGNNAEEFQDKIDEFDGLLETLAELLKELAPSSSLTGKEADITRIG